MSYARCEHKIVRLLKKTRYILLYITFRFWALKNDSHVVLCILFLLLPTGQEHTSSNHLQYKPFLRAQYRDRLLSILRVLRFFVPASICMQHSRNLEH